MTCCQMAPIHYLNHCCSIMNGVLWYLPDDNFILRADDFGLHRYLPGTNKINFKSCKWWLTHFINGYVLKAHIFWKCVLLSFWFQWSHRVLRFHISQQQNQGINKLSVRIKRTAYKENASSIHKSVDCANHLTANILTIVWEMLGLAYNQDMLAFRVSVFQNITTGSRNSNIFQCFLRLMQYVND